MIRIREAGRLGDIIKFVYNPVSELALALDLLSHPDHKKLHSSWAGEVLDGFSRKDKELLVLFDGMLEGYLNLDHHLDYLSYSINDDNWLTGCSAFLSDERSWITPLEKSEAEKLKNFLIYVWENYIYPAVRDHRKEILGQLEEGKRLLGEKGCERLFAKISDRVSFNSGNDFIMDKWVESDFLLGELKVFYIELSIFAFPYLVISDRHEEGSFWMTWDVPFREDRILIPGIDRISRRAFALSDKSRLRILLMLSGRSMTQKELGKLMGFAKSTMSRHIGILIDAELVVPDDGERNVLLGVNRKALEQFSMEITGWLE